MGTVAEKLQAIRASKAAIKAAIEAKGVTSVGDILADYADKISEIQSGSEPIPIKNVAQFRNIGPELPDWINEADWSDVVSISSMFYGCTLERLSLSYLTDVINAAQAFRNCNRLTEISLEGLPNVTNVSGMFSACYSLTYVDMRSCPKLGFMEGMFDHCSKLESVSFPELTNVTSLGSCFSGCTSLKTLTLSGLTASALSFSNMLSGCSSLTELTISTIGSGLSSLSSANVSRMLSGCTSLKRLNLAGNFLNMSLPSSSASSVFWYLGSALNLSALEELDSPDATKLVNTFKGYSAIKKLTLNVPEVKDFNTTFDGCSTLTSLRIHASSEVTRCVNAFLQCRSIEDLVLDLTFSSSITSLGSWGLSHVTKISAEQLWDILDNLPTVATTRNCVIGTTNLAKLTEEQIQAVEAKGWSLT